MSDNNIHFTLKDQLKKYRHLFQQHFQTEHFPAGTTFNINGFAASHPYFLLSGTVYVYTTSISGQERLIGIHERNTIFNLDSFRKKTEATVTTRAQTNVSTLSFTLDDLDPLLREEPDLYRDLLLYTADVLRLMCYDATEQSAHNVRTRLINFFLLYIKDRDTPVVPLSQERLAAAINASRVQVARVCSDLKKEGLILTGKRQITIPSREALARSTRHS